VADSVDPSDSEQESDDQAGFSDGFRARFSALTLTNFLSYKRARLDLDQLVAVIGPNASGKSNLVAAFKLLREIPVYGLSVAIARRGGFDQLRHRSNGRPYDPSIRLEFQIGGSTKPSYYELSLGAIEGRGYKVKSERAEVCIGSELHKFVSDGVKVKVTEPLFDFPEDGQPPEAVPTGEYENRDFPVAPGQSALANASFAGYVVYQVLQQLQTVEINPAKVADLQEPTSTRDFTPDGSNATSVFQALGQQDRADLIDELTAVVPRIAGVEVQRLADRQSFRFSETQKEKRREYWAKQMSDGTLRTFAMLLALKQPSRPSLVVIEEPEVAIHLGALRTLTDLLVQESSRIQVLLTTHSADIVDTVPLGALRVVWNEDGESRVGNVADHTLSVIKDGLITPGELLRADSLDVVTDK